MVHQIDTNHQVQYYMMYVWKHISFEFPKQDPEAITQCIQWNFIQWNNKLTHRISVFQVCFHDTLRYINVTAIWSSTQIISWRQYRKLLGIIYITQWWHLSFPTYIIFTNDGSAFLTSCHEIWNTCRIIQCCSLCQEMLSKVLILWRFW